MSVHVGLNGLTLLSWGTADQKARYLAPQSKGLKIATFGMTEPDAGSDVVGLQSTARLDGKDYVLNGEKTWISLADVADHFLVIAWTDLAKKKARDHTGLSAFIIERSMPGFCEWNTRAEWGIRAGNTGFFSMRMCVCPWQTALGKRERVSRSPCSLWSRDATPLQRAPLV
jgi:glutaryl-CoA dehydrogenase (non-decarboxylating)